jgi:hypothetical protein
MRDGKGIAKGQHFWRKAAIQANQNATEVWNLLSRGGFL